MLWLIFPLCYLIHEKKHLPEQMLYYIVYSRFNTSYDGIIQQVKRV